MHTSLPTYTNLIGGIRDGAPDQRMPILDPARGTVLAHVGASAPEDVDRAVAAAWSAFREWRETSPAERAAALLALADALDRDSSEFAALESRNAGKPVTAVGAEIESAVDCLRFFAGAARTSAAQSAAEYATGATSLLRREPLGVVALITPWNYPLLMAAWKLGPAIAAGNTVVLKPSELTPLTTLRLAELASEILPPGVLNVVNGDGPGCGARLAGHPDVRLVSVTGSTATGKAIMRAAADTVQRVQLELGGAAAAIVFPDTEIDATARGIAAYAFANAGQDCTAACRVLVHEAVHDELTEALAAQARALRVGDPADPATEMGPLISAAHRDRVARRLEDAVAAGAELLTGGVPRPGAGYFYPPTVLRGVDQRSGIVREEVFGPVLTVQPFRDEQEARALADDSDYGLAASIWTRDVRRAHRVANRLGCGTVWINEHGRLIPEMPHGGVKQSGFGHDLSVYSLEAFTTLKHIMVNLA